MNNQKPKISFRPIHLINEYGAHIRAFKPNARMYLLNVIITGGVMGVFRLLFNFFVLSLGFNEAMLGNLITTSSFVALLAALPLGYLAVSGNVLRHEHCLRHRAESGRRDNVSIPNGEQR